MLHAVKRNALFLLSALPSETFQNRNKLVGIRSSEVSPVLVQAFTPDLECGYHGAPDSPDASVADQGSLFSGCSFLPHTLMSEKLYG